MLGTLDLLADGQQSDVLVRAPAASPPPRSSGRGGCRRPGCPGAGAEDPLAEGSRAANWSWASATPRSPVQRARRSRAARVSGARGPGPARGWQQGRHGRGPRPDPPPPRSGGRAGRGWSGCPGVGAGPARGWAAGRHGRGRGRIPRLPVQRARLPRSARVSRCSGPSTARGRQQGGELIPGPAASPASPVQTARSWRADRVSGCSGPRTRSRIGSRAARSRAPAASPRLVPAGDRRGVQGVRCSGPAPAHGRAATRQAGRGPRPHPLPPRSSGRGGGGPPGAP